MYSIGGLSYIEFQEKSKMSVTKKESPPTINTFRLLNEMLVMNLSAKKKVINEPTPAVNIPVRKAT